jgi:hypothetical protein
MRAFIRSSFLRFFLFSFAVAWALVPAGATPVRAAQRQAAPEPTINGDQGSCSAAFVVTNGEQKPIYNVKIDLTFHYGFMNLHKESLEVFTNADGKARFEGLPNFVKKPLEFRLQSGDRQKTITDDPGVTCYATEAVTLP